MLKGNGLYAAGGLIGAIPASTCCIVPFILLTLGISGAWISHVTPLAPYQPLFLIASLGFLAAGFWKVYGKPKSSCEEGSACATTRSDKGVKVALWMATLLIVSAFGMELRPLVLVRGVPMKRLVALVGMFGFLAIAGNAMAKEQTVTLTVENMTCSLCPVTVRKALPAVDGVHEARISFEDNKAVIVFDDDRTDVETLINTTTNAGFPSAIAQEDEINDY